MAEEHELPEIHADRVAHTLSFPEDDHSDEEDDHDDHSDEEEHHEMGALVIHIEEEGDYGFALPNDIELFVIMGSREVMMTMMTTMTTMTTTTTRTRRTTTTTTRTRRTTTTMTAARSWLMTMKRHLTMIHTAG